MQVSLVTFVGKMRRKSEKTEPNSLDRARICYYNSMAIEVIKIILRLVYTVWYRSGHNGTDSKSVVPHGTVGSNPTHTAK